MTPLFRNRRVSMVARALAVFASVLLVYAWQIEPRRLHCQRDTIEESGGNGLTIAIVADLHHGMHPMNDSRVGMIVREVNALDADVIVLLGDYHARSPFAEDVPPSRTARLLSKLHAPKGVYAVLGNHDHWFNAAQTEAALAAEGLTVLVNRGVLVPGTRVWLAGLDDDFVGNPDEAAALRGVPSDALVVALTHSPDVWPRLSPRVKVTFAGHTHGGQVKLPFFGAPFVPSDFGQRFLRGLYREGGRSLYVSSGVGLSIAPFRFNVVPEINLVTLR